jgi:methylglutaconyl-CoA hydratase
MSEGIVRCEVDGRGIATLTLNRPELRNAYNRDMIAGLAGGLARLRENPAVRLLDLRGAGKYFQAGADLGFLREAAAMSPADNLDISRLTVAALNTLYRYEKPTLALVQGGCFGGGVGMVAACDMAIATEETMFSITEVRWGVIPAPIMPMLVARMGLGGVTRYALTAERFGADVALRLGLIQQICPAGKLDEAAAPVIEQILMAEPGAVTATKQIAHQVMEGMTSEDSADRLAREAAEWRRSPEAAEGLASFFEKRKPRWYPRTGG